MKQDEATAAAVDGPDPRLAPVVRPDGKFDMLALGELEHAHRNGEPLTAEGQMVYDAVLEDPLAAQILSNAARLWEEYVAEVVEEFGGTLVRETVRWHNGRRSSERQVRWFPAKHACNAGNRVGTPLRAARPRGAGRPKGQAARSSARSGDSGDEGPSDEPPPAGRLCICGCGRDISDKRADARFFDPDACRKRVSRRKDRHLAREPDASRWERSLRFARVIEQLSTAALDGRLAPDRARRLIDQLARQRLQLLGTKLCECATGQATSRPGAVRTDQDGDAVCLLCGHARGSIAPRINGYDATAAVMEALPRDTSLPPRKLPREWRTRPKPQLAERLRGTRREFLDESVPGAVR